MTFAAWARIGEGSVLKRHSVDSESKDLTHAQWDKFEEGTAAALGEVNSTGCIDKYNNSLSAMMNYLINDP